MTQRYAVTVATTYYVDAENAEQAREIVETCEETQDYSNLTIGEQDWTLWEI